MKMNTPRRERRPRLAIQARSASWIRRSVWLAALGLTLLLQALAGSSAMAANRPPAAPLFRDPLYDGAADPTMVWNLAEGRWWQIILAQPGKRPGDGRMGQHPGLLLQNDRRAYIVYFVHQPGPEPASRHTWLQAAQLTFDGETLQCDRDAEFDFVLQPVAAEFTSEHAPTLASEGTASGAPTTLLFSFFRDNGQDGLFLATSEDGLKWGEVPPPGKSFLAPQVGGKLMRDPHLALGPDGTFHLVWTTGWGQPPLMGYARSKDLMHWWEQKGVPVMANEPKTANVWAPELFYDAGRQEWLAFWSSTIPGRFPETEATGDRDGKLVYNHRIYRATTKDFESFSPARLFFNGGFNTIDATMIQTGDRYRLIVKDETRQPPAKNLRVATATDPEGPWSAASAPVSALNWIEGPSAVAVGSDYYVYFDHYTSPHYYGALRTRDFERWEDVSSQVSFPRGTRHGTALRVPRAILEGLRAGR